MTQRLEGIRKWIVIDSNPVVVDNLQSVLVDEEINYLPILPTDKLGDIARLAFELQSDHGIFLNIEYPFEGSNRTDLKGVELIFWLRLKFKFSGPIITYGFLSSAQILRFHPEYVILHAPGNTHWRLGDEFDPKELPKPIDSINIGSLLKPYLLPLGIEDYLRHENANKWAVWKMSNLYRNLGLPGYGSLKATYNQDSVSFLVANELYATNATFHGDIDNNIRVLHESLKELNKKILLIDDMAASGWDKLLQRMLHCEEDEFQALPMVDNESAGSIAQRAIDVINTDKINLILLDLRLNNEKEEADQIENISGFKALKLLKQKRPDIPIIIITASNKLRTSKALLKLGAWGIWTKEGQDNRINRLDLRESLISLMNMVSNIYAYFESPADFAIYGINHRLLQNNEEKYPRKPIHPNEILVGKNKLNQFDICILDSNVWLASQYCNRCAECNKKLYAMCNYKRFNHQEYIERQLLIQRLVEIFDANPAKELIIHNHVYSELREKARAPLTEYYLQRRDHCLYKTAIYALDRIDQLVLNAQLKVEEYSDKTYDKNAYADPMIIDYTLSRSLGLQKNKNTPKGVMIVTGDKALQKKIETIKNTVAPVIVSDPKSLYNSLFERV